MATIVIQRIESFGFFNWVVVYRKAKGSGIDCSGMLIFMLLDDTLLQYYILIAIPILIILLNNMGLENRQKITFFPEG